jgi:hypothetical protein
MYNNGYVKNIYVYEIIGVGNILYRHAYTVVTIPIKDKLILICFLGSLQITFSQLNFGKFANFHHCEAETLEF